MTDAALFATIKEKLFTAVVGDVLDALGHRHCFLPQAIKPLVPGTKLVGRAMPVLEADYPSGQTGGAGPLADKPFGLMLAALDSLKPGDIYLAAGGTPDYALWGGLMSTRAQHLGAAGAVLDGFLRDTDEIKHLGFPVFSHGAFAQDQGVRGKVIDYNVPIRVGQVDVTPGDLVFADDEGILIIPKAIEAEAIDRAMEKATAENKVAEAIRGGMSAQEAFDTYGVM